MKFNNKTFGKVLLVALTIAFGFSMQSCEDQPDKYEHTGGKPTVYYIRPADVEAKDSLIVEGSPQMAIALVGENLRSIKRMFFNDLEAVLNTSYITDHTLIVSVPKSIPNVVNDKITMITHDKDTLFYDFHVAIPAPLIMSMSNEHAKPGTNATIYGSYFIDDPNVPIEVVMPDGTVVKDFVEKTQTSLTFVVPNCTEEGQVAVKSIYGSTKSSFYFNDSRNYLFDFDTPNAVTGVVLGNHGWHPQVIKSDETSLSGNYLMLGDTDFGAEGPWIDKFFSFEYWPGNWQNPENYQGDGVRLTELVDFTDFENMLFKFEMCVPKNNPWSAGAMQIIVGGVDKISNGETGILDIDGNTLGGCNNTYFHNDVLPRGIYRPWETTGSFDTNDEWITVTIPISDFKFGFSGGAASGKLTAKDFSSLVIFVVGGGITGTECHPIIKIDNIRVVPNK